MNQKLQSFFVFLSVITLSACGMQSSDQPANNPASSVATTEIAAVEKPAASSLDGYKSFKFGMSKVEVVKLPECVKNFEAYRTSERSAFANSLDRIDISIQEAKSNIRRYEEELKGPLTPERQRFWEGGINESNQKIAKYEEEKAAAYEKGKNVLEDFSELQINAWAASGGAYCVIDAMGESKKAVPIFDADNKLAAIDIFIGEFNDEKYQTLKSALAEKYQISYEPTTEQIAGFNDFTKSELISTFSGGKVALTVRNTKELKLLEPFLAGAYSEDRRIMILSYMNSIIAVEVGKKASAGRVNAGDL